MPKSSANRALLVLAFALLPGLLAGQSDPEPRTLCWRPAPGPSCRAVLLTEFGLYLIVGSTESTVLDPVTGQAVVRRTTVGGRALGDWGLLVNLSGRDAIGVSVFGSVRSKAPGHEAELVGLARYRRWLGPDRSLDLGIGMPLIVDNADVRRAPYGLVKFNFDRRLGVALRPELRRTISFTSEPRPRTKLFLSAGVEIGEPPGFALSALGAILLGIRTLVNISPN